MDLLNYTQILRPVGQLLDSLRIESFAITMERDGAVIRDKTRDRAQVTPREKTFLAELESHRIGSQRHAQAKRLAEGVLEWCLEWRTSSDWSARRSVNGAVPVRRPKRAHCRRFFVLSVAWSMKSAVTLIRFQRCGNS